MCRPASRESAARDLRLPPWTFDTMEYMRVLSIVLDTLVYTESILLPSRHDNVSMDAVLFWGAADRGMYCRYGTLRIIQTT